MKSGASAADRNVNYWSGRGGDEPIRFGFLLVPGFTLVGFGAAVDPLRLANVVARRTLYQCVTLTLDGAPVRSSAGICVMPDCAAADAMALDAVFVIGPNPLPTARSNRYTLHGMLVRLGCEIIDLGVVRDDPAALEAAFREAAAQADAIRTSGGVSVGEADFIRGLMAKLGEEAFWKIAMRPGRPMAFGRIGNSWLFGLPGNPVAVMVTFYAFVLDALLKLSGVAPVSPLPRFRVPCVTPLKKRPGRNEFQRGVLFHENGEWKVRATASQGSGVLRSMSEANCLIVVEPERGNVEPGEAVDVQPFEGLV